MIISWDKIRHQHPKEEWKELLCKVDSSLEEREQGEFPRFFRKDFVKETDFSEKRRSSYF
ncbi:hypothetical protein DLM75_06975 [Leptospira stimsonii]|uniref:Uncharacterized protein n=1 Tax=Leptospira stimsonii TaxID=2202203 RepID=A0A396ZI96_9LEPT|nr:hypothetical protein DLM75_06975 [Leptospira stimsonii]